MKKTIWIVLFALAGLHVQAQEEAATSSQSELDWYNCSVEEDRVYGAAVNKAYDYLKGRKVKKRPVVALIGGGMDIEHEDLKQAIWKNRKEKANQKDDDRNGLVDDLYGWNFLGGKDGRIMEYTMSEGDREFMRLKERYADYIYNQGKFYKIVDGRRVEVEAPDSEFYYYYNQVLGESKLARAYGGYMFSYVIKEYGDRFYDQMRKRFPEKERFTLSDFETCYDKDAPQDSLSDAAFLLMAYAFSLYNTDQWETVYNTFVVPTVANGREMYEEVLNKPESNDHRREIVGDDPLDLSDDRYGNNQLLTADAAPGVLAAGIIAGKRGNGLGGDGIADQARIMTLRICANGGDPYLKDMALAMRYAIDHGADVIVLPGQNTLYPEAQKRWVAEMLRYAEEKGVLVVVPVYDLSLDLSEITFFPNRNMDGGKALTNLITVAASDKAGNPSMNANYGVEGLDLFAPGIDIYSAYTGDSYRTGSGEFLAAASVAGTAALIKSYFPKLTGSQIRDILLRSVTSRRGAEVEKGIRVDENATQDLFLFEDLCASGGILNAYQAVVEAEKTTKK